MARLIFTRQLARFMDVPQVDTDAADLRSALEARGWQVFGGGTTLRIRRAPQLLPPDLQPDNATAG